jgi:predicted  nucleic acid-binding Zn-ribbon protein
VAWRVLWLAAVPWNQFFVVQELDAQIDQLREEIQLASRLGDPKSAHLDSEIARARRDEATMRSQLAARERAREQTAGIIPTKYLAHYDQLRQRLKSRPWVVLVHGPVCPACNIALPSQVVQLARRADEPIVCPSCARILVWRDVNRTG